MHCVDLGESFPTTIYMQSLASIPKHFLKLAMSASQPAISVFPAYFQISLKLNLQSSTSLIPNFPTTTQFSIEPPIGKPRPFAPSPFLFQCFLFDRATSVFSERLFNRLRPKIAFWRKFMPKNVKQFDINLLKY